MGMPLKFSPTRLADVPLRDIQQMVKVVLVMLWVKTLHIFLDPVFMHQAPGRDGTEVVKYCCQQGLQLIGDEPSAWECLPIQQVRFRDREGLLESAGIPSSRKYSILRFNPPCPAVTIGGPGTGASTAP
jgi:hypothetical protein